MFRTFPIRLPISPHIFIKSPGPLRLIFENVLQSFFLYSNMCRRKRPKEYLRCPWSPLLKLWHSWLLRQGLRSYIEASLAIQFNVLNLRKCSTYSRNTKCIVMIRYPISPLPKLWFTALRFGFQTQGWVDMAMWWK